MAASEIIETPRLLIEPVAERHVTERYVSWLNDPEVVRFSDQRFRTHTLASCLAYRESFLSSPNYFWAVGLRGEAGRMIGTMTAYVDERHRVADIGIMIGEKQVWKQGYASEAWIAVCDFLLRRAGLRKVTAGTIEPNRGMLRVMDKAKMVDDGRRVRQCLWNGREVDVVHRAIFRETWLQQHPQSLFEK